jgi:glycosyltransferase involved in cell wall biosynthesis
MGGVRVQIVDPPAYTPPYDHALSAALARHGADVELVTSRFAHGEVPPPVGYLRSDRFYRWSPPRGRRLARLAQHGPDMLRYARHARRADVMHFQWLPVQALDALLLPRVHPRLLTAHDVLPREPTAGQREGQRRLYARMDAIVVHSEHGARRLCDEVGLEPARVHVIPHGAFHDLAAAPAGAALPPELAGEASRDVFPAPRDVSAPAGRARAAPPDRPIVLAFGLIRPYKGIDVLLDAWRDAAPDAELWIVGMPRMDLAPLRAAAPSSVRWVPRYVTPDELAATFRAADIAVLPYREIDQSGVLFTALAFGTPLLVTAVGGFPEVAATGAAELVPPGDAGALAATLTALLDDRQRRAALAAAAARAAAPDGPYGWDRIAEQTLALYRSLTNTR